MDGTGGSAESPFSLAFDLKKWAEVDFQPADGGAARRLALAGDVLSEVEIWERFASAVRGEGTPAVSGRSVLGTMAILDAARESSRAGCAVDVSAAVDWVI